MDEEHDEVDYFMQMANYIIDSPLRTPEQVNVVIRPMYNAVPKLRAALQLMDPALTKEVYEKMIELRDSLFVSLCDGVVEMSTRETLPLSHPGSAAIIMFVYIATLTIVSEEKLDAINPAHIDIVRRHGLCIFRKNDPRIDPRRYTAQDILDVIWLIGNRWPLLRITDKQELEALFKYMQQLAHRAFMIVGSPQTPAVLDCKFTMPADNLLKASADLIRRLVYGFAGPMAHIRVMFSLEWKRPKFMPPLNETSMREALKKRMLSNIDKMCKLPSLRQEVRLMMDRLSIRHSDLALYVEKCNMEPFEPTSMMMMTKTPEYQTASMQYNRCVDFHTLIDTVDETDPLYDTKHDILTHLNAQNIKLHAVEVDLREDNINLRGDHVLIEPDLMRHVFNTMNEPSPSLISFMGLYHVIMGTSLFLCTCIEQALCVWTQMILCEQNCKLGGIDVIPGFIRMFNNQPLLILPHMKDTGAGKKKQKQKQKHKEEASWGDKAFI